MQSALALITACSALLFAAGGDALPVRAPATRIAVVSVAAPSLPEASSFKPGVFDDVARVSDPLDAQAAHDPAYTRSFRRNADGHFYVTATVNGTPVRFLVDTGATVVVLRKADADRAGLHLRAGDFHQAAATAGGDVAIAPVRLQNMAVDKVAVQNVEAAVDQGELDVSLMGQSYLNRLQGLSIEGDQLRLHGKA